MEMTETQWLMCTNIQNLLHARTAQQMSCRKHRLFAIACCRRIWHLMGNKTRKAVETAELFLERKVTAADLKKCEGSLRGSQKQARAAKRACAPTHQIRAASVWSALCAQLAAAQAERPGEVFNLDPGCRREELEQLPLLRDIFGNPFQPMTMEKAWLTPTVKKMARALYEERNFDDMPILGDALEDADCDHKEILQHCRGDGPHVRGCWVVDLILGKS